MELMEEFIGILEQKLAEEKHNQISIGGKKVAIVFISTRNSITNLALAHINKLKNDWKSQTQRLPLRKAQRASMEGNLLKGL